MDTSNEGPPDAALRRALAELGATRPVDAPGDLVHRAVRRIPTAPPAALYREERSRRMAGLILRLSSLAAVALLAGVSGWGALGGLPQPVVQRDALMDVAQAAVVPQVAALPAEGLVIRVTLAALVGLVLLVPGGLLLGRWPIRTGVAALTLLRRPMRALLLGLSLALALSALLPAALQLGVTIVGLPFAALLVLVAVTPQIAGLATLARAVGARFEGGAPGPELGWPTAAVTALMVLALVAATVVAPLAALVLFSLLAGPGLGALALSRVGTRKT